MTELHGAIPKEILQKSFKERVAFFKEEVFIAHPIITGVQSQLMQEITSFEPSIIVMIFGPTGAGKSRLCKTIHRDLLKIHYENLLANPGLLPSVGVELDADGRIFKWPDHYYKPALKALNEILIEHKVTYSLSPILYTPTGELTFRRDVKEPDLRDALKTALKERRPPIFTIDDAHYLNKVSRTTSLLGQIDSIKCLAEHTGVIHVLFGTYDMVSLLALSPELIRRTRHLHLRRYDCTIPEELEHFKDLLYSLGANLPTEEQPDLVAHTDFFVEQTRGCPGMVKDLLTKALGEAFKAKEKGLPSKYWEIFALTEWEVSALEDKIQQGEYLFKLKMKDIRNKGEDETEVKSNDKGNKRKRKPGERNSIRDKPDLDD